GAERAHELVELVAPEFAVDPEEGLHPVRDVQRSERVAETLLDGHAREVADERLLATDPGDVGDDVDRLPLLGVRVLLLQVPRTHVVQRAVAVERSAPGLLLEAGVTNLVPVEVARVQREVDLDRADRVDDFAEALKVDLHVVVELQSREVRLEGLDHQLRAARATAAEVVRLVDPALAESRDLDDE